MIPALVAGSVGGFVLILSMHRAGMLAERSGLAVLLGAVAFFYPVFAVQAQAEGLVITLHALTFLAFGALALLGYRRSAALLAFGLIAHGLFDAATALTGHPGPVWWPAFCGALDLVAGGTVLFLLHRRDIVQ